MKPGQEKPLLPLNGMALRWSLKAFRRVCDNCGEEYVDEETAGQLLKTAEEAVRAKVQVDIREYVAA